MDGESGRTEPYGATTEMIDQNLVKALAAPDAGPILEELQGASASPVELAKKFRESLGVVRPRQCS